MPLLLSRSVASLIRVLMLLLRNRDASRTSLTIIHQSQQVELRTDSPPYQVQTVIVLSLLVVASNLEHDHRNRY